MLGVLTLMLATVYALLVLWVGSSQQSLWLFNTLVASFVILILYDQVRHLGRGDHVQGALPRAIRDSSRSSASVASVRTHHPLPQMRDQVLETLHASGRAKQVSMYLQVEVELAFALFGFRGTKPPETLTHGTAPGAAAGAATRAQADFARALVLAAARPAQLSA